MAGKRCAWMTTSLNWSRHGPLSRTGKELEVAEAVYAYAVNETHTRETEAETLANSEEKLKAYNEALAAYQEAVAALEES